MKKKTDTKILILCGGRGRRMGKYTRKIPKPLVKVGRIPIIQHKINYYKILSSKIKNKKCTVGIVGIGYVGIKLLIQFNKNKIRTIGFDKAKKITELLKKGLSPYSYISDKAIKPVNKFSVFANNFDSITKCDVIIICLPTPIKKNTKPDLSIIDASFNMINKKLVKGQLIILESTTYPGTTRGVIANKIIKISEMYSSYHRKHILLEIYKSMKRRGCKSQKIFENWMTIHNLNY